MSGPRCQTIRLDLRIPVEVEWEANDCGGFFVDAVLTENDEGRVADLQELDLLGSDQLEQIERHLNAHRLRVTS